LKNNETLLIQAKQREEELQNKYCSDIQKAVSLNKQLNNIISKKNKLIADIKIKQNKKEADATNETLKLYKENANLFNEYNKIMEIKEIEKYSLEEEKNKLKTNLEQLEMEKIKSDYKSTILEEENKLIFNQIIENIKLKK
jgi:hypothetical protein